MKSEILNLIFLIHLSITLPDYWSLRENLIEFDRDYAVGSRVFLTRKEMIVNDILMRNKERELKLGFEDTSGFLAQQHFFQAKQNIEKSPVFNIIKQIPKGASLHSHDQAVASQEYLYDLTFRDDLYGCINGNDFLLRFFHKYNINTDCNWTLLKDFRRTYQDFDSFLKEKLTLIRNDPYKVYPHINAVWTTFERIFNTVDNLVSYKPIFEDIFYQTLKELYEDNVKYLELRTHIPKIYDLKGKIYSEVEIIDIYFDTLKKFQIDYPDFHGVKLIYAPSRNVDNSTMDNYVSIYRQIKSSYPDFVVGFDLVGQEDLGNPLTSYISQLLEIKDIGAKFFFHAGETNWYGESTDLNLVDAILLNTTRIGHGYALLKHPALAELVKQRNIAIEICPISNQVLKLVSDLRNHPGAVLIANGFPVVIAADDPSFWGAKGLSYDWYMAFMTMTSKETGLRFLKQLAINSIEYSSLDEREKRCAFAQWNKDWNSFIHEMLGQYYNEIQNIITIE